MLAVYCARKHGVYSIVGGAACLMHLLNIARRCRVSMKLAVACAPVRRVQRNNEYNARDYEVTLTTSPYRVYVHHNLTVPLFLLRSV